jgi:photosystem II stability/assembly factor-like uncharacterized protein
LVAVRRTSRIQRFSVEPYSPLVAWEGILGTSYLPGRGAAVALLSACLWLVFGCIGETYEDRFAEGDIDIYDDLYAATAVGEDNLWVAGYFGAVYRTRDAGETWRKLETPTEKSIYDISFADEQHGWLVGRRGFILKTSDGGDSWTVQRTPREPAQHIFSVSAISPQRAWAVGEWGGRYETFDGGETWVDRSFALDESNPTFQYLTEFELERYYKGETLYDDLYLNDVFFLDEKNGWIAGEYGLTYWTADGGATWEKGKIIGEVDIPDMEFKEGQRDLVREQWDVLFEISEVLLEKEYLRIRIDGCLTKSELREHGTYIADERAGSVRDFLEGEGVGQERIRLLNTTPMDEETVDMDAFGRSKLCDAPPKVFINLLETPFLFDVKFKDPLNGVVAGLGGVMLRSTDGGRTWHYANSNSEQALFAADFGANAVVAVGERGLQRVSQDGGLTYARPEEGVMPRVFTFMRDLTFGTPDRGWIVGAAGMVLRSSDGGTTWQQVLPPSEADALDDGAGE